MLGASAGLLTAQLLAVVTLPANLSLLAVGALMSGCAGAMLHHERSARRSQAACTRASALIQLGELPAARELLDAALASADAAPHLHALLLFNRGVVDLRSGDLRAARARLNMAIETGWITARGSLAGTHPQVCTWMTLLETLAGDTETARRWQAVTRAAADVYTWPYRHLWSSARRELMAQRLCVDATLELREGDYEGARRRIENQRPAASAHLSASDLRMLDVLVGFAREHSAKDHYRDHGAAITRPAGLAQEFAFLGVRWPEMAMYLRRFGGPLSALPAALAS
jgi:hypothetical protein